jgi:hypothetical protein
MDPKFDPVPNFPLNSILTTLNTLFIEPKIFAGRALTVAKFSSKGLFRRLAVLSRA